MPLLFIMKIKRYINAFLTLIGFAIVGWFSFIRPDVLLALGIFTCISGYFLIFICLTPAGSLTLGKTPAFSFVHWLWKVTKGQLAMLLLTVAALCAFFGAGPFFADGKIPLQFATTVVWDYTRLQWGIFPWGVYGLWALVLAYVTYVKKGVPYLYQVAQGFIPKRLEPAVKTFVEGTTSGATIIATCLVVTSIILLLSYAFEKFFKIQHFAVPFITIFFLSFLTMIFTFRYGRKFFRRLFKNISLNRLYSFIILLIIPVLILSAAGNKWFIEHYNQLYQSSICHHCGNYFANVPLETRFAAVYWGWWLIWTPLCGSYLASISQGRSIRAFVLGLYFVPILFFAVLYYWGVMLLTALLSFVNQISISWLLLLLAFFTWIVFANMIKACYTSAFFVNGYMTVQDNLKRNRLFLNDASKIVGLHKIVQKLFMTVIAILFLHTTAGWYGIQLQVAAMGVLVINAVYGSFNFLFLRFFKDQTWLNNQNIRPYRPKNNELHE